ncbi:MAG: biotin/lipoate A/B protein ligase family protein [Sulfolobaceae archaeon]
MRLRVILDEFPDDPYLNLAVDETLLLRGKLPVLRIWRNDKSVILGIRSKVENEVNLNYLKLENVKLARRITGGGAVFHDMGNVNYTIIIDRESYKDKEPIDLLYNFLLRGIIHSIEKISNSSYEVRVYNETDVTYKGFKVSGNAGYITKDKVLLHGTLLVSANIELLYKVLIIPPKDYKERKEREGKDVNMIKYRVNNLSSLLDRKITYEEVTNAIITSFSNLLNMEPYLDRLSKEEIFLSNELKNNKYSNPNFIFKN